MRENQSSTFSIPPTISRFFFFFLIGPIATQFAILAWENAIFSNDFPLAASLISADSNYK